jgi:hypothetical protein
MRSFSENYFLQYNFPMRLAGFGNELFESHGRFGEEPF